MKLAHLTTIVCLPIVLGLAVPPNPVYACVPRPVQSGTKQQAALQIACAKPPTLVDTSIVLGERVGPVTRTTTYRQLEQKIGKRFLSNRTIPGPEGEGEWAATMVTLRQNQSFIIVWADNTRTKPLFVRINSTAWKTPEGIGVGTSFNELRQKAGEFRLTGLAWDYAGQLLLQDTRLAHYAGKVRLVVDVAPGKAQQFRSDYRAVAGDAIFSSTNPHWQPLGMRVVEMTVYLNNLE